MIKTYIENGFIMNGAKYVEMVGKDGEIYTAINMVLNIKPTLTDDAATNILQAPDQKEIDDENYSTEDLCGSRTELVDNSTDLSYTTATNYTVASWVSGTYQYLRLESASSTATGSNSVIKLFCSDNTTVTALNEEMRYENDVWFNVEEELQSAVLTITNIEFTNINFDALSIYSLSSNLVDSRYVTWLVQGATLTNTSAPQWIALEPNGIKTVVEGYEGQGSLAILDLTPSMMTKSPARVGTTNKDIITKVEGFESTTMLREQLDAEASRVHGVSTDILARSRYDVFDFESIQRVPETVSNLIYQSIQDLRQDETSVTAVLDILKESYLADQVFSPINSWTTGMVSDTPSYTQTETRNSINALLASCLASNGGQAMLKHNMTTLLTSTNARATFNELFKVPISITSLPQQLFEEVKAGWNWWLIAGIALAGIAAIGLVFWLIQRKKKVSGLYDIDYYF